MTSAPTTLPCIFNVTPYTCMPRELVRNLSMTGDLQRFTITDTIALSTIGIIILIGNGLICFLFYKVRGLRREPPNILICNQACVDITIGGLFIPVHIFDGYVSELAISPFVLCYCLFVSMFSLCSLAVDRYIAVLQPLKYMHIFTEVSVRWEMVFIWILPLVFTLVPLSYQFLPMSEQRLPRRIFETILWAFVLILFLAMVAMYMKVFGNAKMNINSRLQKIQTSVAEKNRLKAQLKLQKKELHIAALFALFMGFFFISYLPILIINFYLILGKIHMVSSALITASLYSYVVNSIINPILCILLKKDFKKGLLQMIKKRGKNRGSEQFTETSSKGKGSYSKSISTSVGPAAKDASLIMPLNIKEM